MKYNLKISANTENIIFERYYNQLTISVNDKKILNLDIKELKPLMDEYKNDMDSKTIFTELQLYKSFFDESPSKTFDELFRSFLLFNRFMEFSASYDKYSSNDRFEEYTIERFLACGAAKSLIDWTFTKISSIFFYDGYIDDKDLNNLFETGILYKITLVIQEKEITKYFLPFEAEEKQKEIPSSLRPAYNKMIKSKHNDLNQKLNS